MVFISDLWLHLLWLAPALLALLFFVFALKASKEARWWVVGLVIVWFFFFAHWA